MNGDKTAEHGNTSLMCIVNPTKRAQLSKNINTVTDENFQVNAGLVSCYLTLSTVCTYGTIQKVNKNQEFYSTKVVFTYEWIREHN